MYTRRIYWIILEAFLYKSLYRNFFISSSFCLFLSFVSLETSIFIQQSFIADLVLLNRTFSLFLVHSSDLMMMMMAVMMMIRVATMYKQAKFCLLDYVINFHGILFAFILILHFATRSILNSQPDSHLSLSLQFSPNNTWGPSTEARDELETQSKLKSADFSLLIYLLGRKSSRFVVIAEAASWRKSFHLNCQDIPSLQTSPANTSTKTATTIKLKKKQKSHFISFTILRRKPFLDCLFSLSLSETSFFSFLLYNLFSFNLHTHWTNKRIFFRQFRSLS